MSASRVASLKQRLEMARRQVIEAARDWSKDVDHRESDLLAALRRELTIMERLEMELATEGEVIASDEAVSRSRAGYEHKSN
jgi:hypothetical protein